MKLKSTASGSTDKIISNVTNGAQQQQQQLIFLIIMNDAFLHIIIVGVGRVLLLVIMDQ